MSRSMKLFLCFDCVLLLLIGGLILYRNRAENAEQAAANQAAATALPAIDEAAGEYVAPTPAPDDGSGGIAIPGWGMIEIPAGQTEVAVDFPNPVQNAERYYLTFQLMLKDTGEVLYQSGLVPPGKVIQAITLSRPLEAGTYAAVVRVQPYRMDEEKTPTNNADMETELIAK